MAFPLDPNFRSGPRRPDRFTARHRVIIVLDDRETARLMDHFEDEHVQRTVESNLADCTLIGPEAGEELRQMVYGS